MKKFTFQALNELSTDIANCCFATKEQKENIRENILLLVAAACRTYEADVSFKRTIKAFATVAYEKRRNRDE